MNKNEQYTCFYNDVRDLKRSYCSNRRNLHLAIVNGTPIQYGTMKLERRSIMTQVALVAEQHGIERNIAEDWVCG